jgi:hypothetical protein
VSERRNPGPVFVERVFDAERINELVNDPAIRPDVANMDEGVLDLSPQIANRAHIMLMGDHGGVMFFNLLPGIYECHTVVKPEARGPWSLGLAKACLHWMFTRTDAYEVVTRVPRPHQAGKGLAISAGMRMEFSRPDMVDFHGEKVTADIYSLRIQDWVPKADVIEEMGFWVHKRLHEEAKRIGVTKEAHPNDPNHNRYLGAAYEMACAGQPVKALAVYNRWAQIARHATVDLISLKPVIFKMDIGLMTIRDGDFEITPC